VRSMCKSGHGTARKQTDKCKVCVVWDQCVGPRCRKKIREIRNSLEDTVPDYFHDFVEVSPQEEWSAKEWNGHENLAYVTRMQEYINAKMTSGRIGFDELEAKETLCLEEFSGKDGLIEVVSEFQSHWALRDYLKTSKMHEEQNPEPFTCYIDEDFEDH